MEGRGGGGGGEEEEVEERRRSDTSSSSLLPHLCKLLIDLRVRLLLRRDVGQEEMGREARGIKEGRGGAGEDERVLGVQVPRGWPGGGFESGAKGR